ncbi:hypothetical protein [Caulobacter sp. NIBR2454]|uniref:hypothetical protein n=1 Tax=Caulobacter sp. NIBR2454 TaxID=3015996 RepID=UPI0022B6DD0E|nr:hypothetical protein [Caulobacter sp. NIBR2454]
MATFSQSGLATLKMVAGPLSRRSLLSVLPAALASLSTGVIAQTLRPTPLQIVARSGVALSGVYAGHLQGACTNDRDAIYWSMTTSIVKTDVSGNVLRQITVANHHGDLCHVDGKIYVAVNLALFNDPQKRSDSWIYVYDADDLSLLKRHAVSEVVYGAGGIAFGDDRFIVVGGLPDGVGANALYEYDDQFRLRREIVLKTGQTYKGIQTAAYDGSHWWFGCYGKPDFMEVLIRADRTFDAIGKFAFDASTGLIALDRDTFLVAKAGCGKESCVARLVPVDLNAWVKDGTLRPL